MDDVYEDKSQGCFNSGSASVMFLAWAPWMDDKAIHDKVFEERARIDGTIDKQTGELICDYKVTWFPFGRWVASCEGGYFYILG